MNNPTFIGSSPFTNTLLLNANYSVMARGYIELMRCDTRATDYELRTVISEWRDENTEH